MHASQKPKNKPNTQGKTFSSWLEFKAINALNSNKYILKKTHKYDSELVKLGIYGSEALKCQDSNPAYPYVAHEIWPNKNKIRQQNFHHIQISSNIEV
jgi:hypothetical protein